MKTIMTIIIMMIGSLCHGQSNYFKLFDDNKIITEKEFNLQFKSLVNNLAKDYSLTPIIYHKNFVGDSIINYVRFQKTWWGDKKVDPSKFEMIYKQDTLLLFLDRQLPEFTLRDLNGKYFNSSKLLGKPTLINFWNKGCSPCIQEIPELNELQKKYAGKVNFISIAIDDPESVKDFIIKRPYGFYHLVTDSKFYKNTFKISFIPVNMFLDKKGYVRQVRILISPEYDKTTGKVIKSSDHEFDKILDELIKL
jgi:cytochrome c biogenesis protein CcmG, thiol:disulfide interchange protein DsbE